MFVDHGPRPRHNGTMASPSLGDTNDIARCGTYIPVMRSETVDLRTRPVSDQKVGLCLGLGGAGPVLCCETQICHARRHNDLDGHSIF